MQPVEKWYRAMKTGIPASWDELLDDDVVFHSPVVFTPQKGKKVTKIYLLAAARVLGMGPGVPTSQSKEGTTSGFRYVNEIIGEKSASLEFESQIKGTYINGVDLLSWNKSGRLTKVKVLIRPLQAVNLLHKQMQAMLEVKSF